jgi:formylglycine-generating enzyme required for sulfatase activity
MLAGRVPFEADSTMSVLYMQINEPPPPIPGASPKVQTVINRALAKNPNDRYQTCREMAVDFFLALGMTAEAETIIDSMPNAMKNLSGPHTIVTSQKPQTTASRKPLWIGVGIVAFIGLVVLVLGSLSVITNLLPNSNTAQTQSPASTEAGTTPVTEAVNSGPPSSEGMVKIPAGPYEVGMTPTDDYHSATTTIDLLEFWVDKYQVTNAQYQKFITATGSKPPEVWPGEDDHPVRGVAWSEAAAYCGSLNKRLLTEAEWEAAGRGPGANPQIFPWGNDPTAGGKTLSMPDQDTYAVGSQPFNVSPLGVYDLVGNVWEWVTKPYSNIQAGYNILRGGRFGNPQDLAYRLAVAPDDTRYVQYAGFRCASDQVK